MKESTYLYKHCPDQETEHFIQKVWNSYRVRGNQPGKVIPAIDSDLSPSVSMLLTFIVILTLPVFFILSPMYSSLSKKVNFLVFELHVNGITLGIYSFVSYFYLSLSWSCSLVLLHGTLVWSFWFNTAQCPLN